ncbi:hypothetical protein Tco_0139104 [Tanacetum coccineum]
MSESAKRHEEKSNLIKEIRAMTDAAIRNQGASIKTLEIQIGQMSRSSQYAVSTGQNSKLLYKSRQMTIPFLSHLDYHYCEQEEGNYRPKFRKAYGASHINNAIPRKEKDPGSFTLPCFINNTSFDNALVDLGASVSVMPLSTYLNLGLGELAHIRLIVELAYRTVKYPKGIVKNVLVGIGKFTFPVEFIILDMPEDIKVSLILRRPFLSTARAKIDVYKRKITLRIGEENIIFKSVKTWLEEIKEMDLVPVPTIKEGRGALMNVPIFVGTFSVVTDFAVLENMDAYRDKGMGNVLVGEPFLREVGIKARRFDGTITIYNGDDEVTYQMV